MKPRAAVLTISDRSFRGERPDAGGPALAALAERLGWEVAAAEVLPDDEGRIAARLKELCDEAGLDLILTTGGTGPGPRDRTPEATRAALDRELPGLAERMRREGERFTPLAALSRGVCGLRGRTVIVNLPGSPRGAGQSLEAVAELLTHAVEMAKGGDHDPS